MVNISRSYGIRSSSGLHIGMGISEAASSTPPGPSLFYATWNPADKAALVTLSNGNLTAESSTTNWRSARSTISKTSGKWYWEITMTTGTEFYVGVARSTATLENYIGADADGWAHQKNPVTGKVNNNLFAEYGAGYTTGDIISVLLDMDAGEITCYKNGVSQGLMYTGVTGTIFATYTGYQSSQTANFGATPFAYTVPTGYNPGLYEVVPDPIIAADWDNAGGYVPEYQGSFEAGMKLAGQRDIGVPDYGAFTGATGVTVASTQGGTIGTVTIVSGRLVFDYTTPNTDPDYLNIAGTDAYGRAFSFTKTITPLF